MSIQAQQAQIKADNAELIRLISELPISDGALPINDVVKDGEVITKGAHGVVNDTEAKIAGITKRYTVSLMLQNASNPSVNTDDALALIRQVVTSPDASEKAPRSDTEAKERIAGKIEALGFNNDVKAVVTAIVNNQVTDEIKQKIASQAFVESLPPGNLTALVDENVQRLAQEHHYQISPEGNLFNLSSVRLGHVHGRPSHNTGSDSLQATFNAQSDDLENKKKSVNTFLSNIGPQWLEGKSEINIYDIGCGGTPEAAIAAVKAIKAIKPDVVVNFTGVDLAMNDTMAKQATEALQAVGVNSVTLEAGTFGLADFDPSIAQHKGKMDLVLGTHVYNLGARTDGVPTTFLKQVDELMSPDALSLIQHGRAESWINDIRNARSDMLRGGASTAVADLGRGMEQSGQEFRSFGSPTTVKFYLGDDPSNSLFKDKYLAALQDMEVGKYDIGTRNALMQKHGISTDGEKAEFNALANMLEYYMASPLESFKTPQRMAVIGDIQAEVTQQQPGKPQGQVVEYTEVQVLPKNKERLAQVEQAVVATKAQLAVDPVVDTLRQSPMHNKPPEPTLQPWQQQEQQQHGGSYGSARVYVAPRTGRTR